MMDVMHFPVRISVGLALGTSSLHLENEDDVIRVPTLRSVSDDDSVSRRHLELVDELKVEISLSGPGS